MLLLALLLGVQARAESRAAETPPLGDRIDQYFSRLVPFGFSGSVLVARDGEVILSSGYGTADAAGRANGPETVFGIQSVTKQFTAAAILALEQDGRLKVADTLGRFFPDTPSDKREITLAQLLSHTSGVVWGTDQYFDDSSREGILRAAFKEPLAFEPGSSDLYSNIGYAILGAVVEKVSGQSYEAFVAERLFERAGLRSTGYRLPGWRPSDLARTYVGNTDNGTVLDRPYPDWNFVGSGAMGSTVDDLYRWHLALGTDRVLGAEARAKMIEPVANDYALGWIVRSTERGLLVEHDGGNSRGGAANVRRYMDAGVVTIVLANRDGEEMLFGNRIVDHLDRLVFEEGALELPPEVESVSLGSFDELEGRYRNAKTGGEWQIGEEGGLLVARARGQSAVEAALPAAREAGGERLNQMAVRALSALAGGDAAVMTSMGGERVAGFLTARVERAAGGLGAFRSYRVIGTVPDWISSMGTAMTIAAADFEGGSLFFRLHWTGDRLMGLGGAAITEPAELRLLPRPAGEGFGGYHLPTASSVAALFERNEHGVVVGLRLGTSSFARASPDG